MGLRLLESCRTHFFHSHCSSKRPNIGIADVGEVFLDGSNQAPTKTEQKHTINFDLQTRPNLGSVPRYVQPCVGTMGRFTFAKSHAPSWSTRTVGSFESSSIVPGQTDQDGPAVFLAHKVSQLRPQSIKIHTSLGDTEKSAREKDKRKKTNGRKKINK